MLNAAMLGLMEQLAMDIMTLTEELSETDFFASRLTRKQTLQLLNSLVRTASGLPQEVRERLHQIDWNSWVKLGQALARPEQHPLLVWVAIRELTPLTVQRLHDYKRNQPELFSMAP